MNDVFFFLQLGFWISGMIIIPVTTLLIRMTWAIPNADVSTRHKSKTNL